MARGGGNNGRRGSFDSGGSGINNNRFANLETNDRTLGEDSNSPYYLSNGDHPGTFDMDAFQAGDVEDWDRIQRAMDTLGTITVSGDILRTEGGEKSCVDVPIEDIPLSKEKLPQEVTSHGCSSKKKRRSHKSGSRKTSRTEKSSDSKGQEDGYERMLEHLRHQFEEANCDLTAVGPDITECRLVEDAVAQVYIRTRAIRHSYDELLRKNKEKRDLLTTMKAKVATLDEKYKATERERAQSAAAHINLKVSLGRAESLLKKQQHQIDEKDQAISEKDQRIAENDLKIADKDLKIAEWEKRYNLAKYSGALWAKDQTLLRFPNAKPFVEWLEPSADEPKVDIGDDIDEAT